LDIFTNLDEEIKAKVEEIMKQRKEGTITSEEADAQLAELGVELPKKEKLTDILENLDETTKTKAQSLVDAEKAQLSDLGVEDFPFGGYEKKGTDTNQ